jgi:amino acid transporter
MVFTAIEVGGLVLVVLAGLSHEAAPPARRPDAEPAIMAAAALLFFVYLGFENIANLAEEVNRPGRTIPLALFVSIALTTLLYVLVAIAVVHMLPPAQLAASDAPLADAIRVAWPDSGRMLSAIALFATANTVLVTVIAASRLAFSMARDGELHRALAALHVGRQTPWVAALMILAMAVVLLPIGSVRILAEMSSFAALLAFLVVNLALIATRYKHPRHPRPFRVPGSIGRMPILPLLALAAILLLLGHFEWPIYLAGALAFGLVAVAFAARHWAKRR